MLIHHNDLSPGWLSHRPFEQLVVDLEINCCYIIKGDNYEAVTMLCSVIKNLKSQVNNNSNLYFLVK